MAEQIKQSGIGWAESIPEEWNAKKIKYHFSVVNGSTPDSGDFDCWDGDVAWITPADMEATGEVAMGQRNITKHGYNSCGTTMLPTGSIVISTRAPIGKVNITTAELCTNQGCKSLVRDGFNRYFYYVLLASQSELALLGRGTTFLELSTYDLNSFKIIVPSTDEQKAIAEFLDRECMQIDSIIADLEKQIKTLKQYKKSLITETVTKGLDKSVPMKDSGIAWIGEMPLHWKCKKLGYMANVTKLAGFEFTDYFEYVDEGVIAIRGLNLKNFHLNLDDVQHIPVNTSDMLPRSQIHENDVLISYAGTVGAIGLIEDDGNRYHLAPNVGKITVVNEIIPKYLAYYLISYTGQECIDQLKNKNAQESISMENIRRIKTLVPPLDEQKKVCSFLDRTTKKIDDTIKTQNTRLHTMMEHKKSLIYEYVTGKKRVKEVQ